MRRIRSVPYVDISMRYEIVFCEVAQVTSHNKADRKNSQTYIPVRASLMLTLIISQFHEGIKVLQCQISSPSEGILTDCARALQ